MNIVICGAGQVGTHSADVLAAAGHSVTVIDHDPARVSKIEETLDVRTLCGNCASAECLDQAGVAGADLLVAATAADEINLLTAAVAKGVGVKRTVVRVHHRTYFEQRGLNYQAHLGIDHLICPEYSTALAIGRILRNPGAIAVQHFARGSVELHEFTVGEQAPAVGVSLAELGLPKGTRLAAITRAKQAFLPEGATVVEAKDRVVLVGNANVFEQARALFTDRHPRRRRVALMGGPPMAVWLARALRAPGYSIRLFEQDRTRAEELAAKLDWVTVIQADPSDRAVFDEEKLGDLDAFIALLDDDEHNILGSAWAKSLGAKQAFAVVQRADYLHLINSVGIDRAFSPRIVAASEIELLLTPDQLTRVAALAEGAIDVYRLRVGRRCKDAGKQLRDIRMSSAWVVAAVQRAGPIHVPSADDTILAGDTLLVVGRPGNESKLRKLFDAD